MVGIPEEVPLSPCLTHQHTHQHTHTHARTHARKRTLPGKQTNFHMKTHAYKCIHYKYTNIHAKVKQVHLVSKTYNISRGIQSGLGEMTLQGDVDSGIERGAF